jgi:hypothetical protein
MCSLCKKTTKTGRNERGLPHSSTAVRKRLLFVYDVSCKQLHSWAELSENWKT